MMLYKCYLRNGVVYVPTVGKRGAVYTIIEPVAVVSVGDTENLRQALIDAIGRKNVDVMPLKGKRPPPVLPKYAGEKSWAAFERNASTWNIKENDGNYRIGGYRKHPDGYWVEDREKDIEFSPGTTIEAVVDRMIAILREASQKTKQ
jgi:hypothetical protein